MPLIAVLTAMGLEKVRIASEVNFKANDISFHQSSDVSVPIPVPQRPGGPQHDLSLARRMQCIQAMTITDVKYTIEP